MSKQHNLTLLWDDTITLDESVLATLKSVGLAPLPVNVHTIDRIEHEIVGPTILHLSADSFANLEAVSAFVEISHSRHSGCCGSSNTSSTLVWKPSGAE